MAGLRSIPKALRDTAVLVDELQLQKSGVISIGVSSWGGADVHLRPKEFVRVFNLLRVTKANRDMKVLSNGNLHASFSTRNTRFVTIVEAGTTAFNALRQSVSGLIDKQPPKGLITGSKQLDLTGPA